ncbi:DUF971 domain-containing protein [Variovorax sp. YR752]|uniref:DUF971 domain-containing protein n=1 Tax=Variovorax sp. YR752 TaxID=1884383 RepID=UPI0031380BF7
MGRPLEICDHRATGLLEITWDDAGTSRLPHAWLRAHCRCAACEQRARTQAPRPAVAAALRLTGIHPVGEQGLNLVFSDGHGRGIYPWAYLRELGNRLPAGGAALLP